MGPTVGHGVNGKVGHDVGLVFLDGVVVGGNDEAIVGHTVGLADGFDMVGTRDATCVGGVVMGLEDGVSDDVPVGDADGLALVGVDVDGSFEGVAVGRSEGGTTVGSALGYGCVGIDDGDRVGWRAGMAVEPLWDGPLVGSGPLISAMVGPELTSSTGHGDWWIDK